MPEGGESGFVQRRDDELGPDGKPKRWTTPTEWRSFDLSSTVIGPMRDVVARHLDTGDWANLSLEELRRVRQINDICELRKYEPLFGVDRDGNVSVDPEIEALLREIIPGKG